jgi:hypothetical protein
MQKNLNINWQHVADCDAIKVASSLKDEFKASLCAVKSSHLVEQVINLLLFDNFSLFIEPVSGSGVIVSSDEYGLTLIIGAYKKGIDLMLVGELLNYLSYYANTQSTGRKGWFKYLKPFGFKMESNNKQYRFTKERVKCQQ